jgi:hypothetical protein
MSGDGRLSALMAGAQKGDRGSYATLLNECIPVIREYASVCGVAGGAEGIVVCETLKVIHAARRTYDPSRSFEAWLLPIVAIGCGRIYRRPIFARGRSTDALRRTRSVIDLDRACR